MTTAAPDPSTLASRARARSGAGPSAPPRPMPQPSAPPRPTIDLARYRAIAEVARALAAELVQVAAPLEELAPARAVAVAELEELRPLLEQQRARIAELEGEVAGLEEALAEARAAGERDRDRALSLADALEASTRPPDA